MAKKYDTLLDLLSDSKDEEILNLRDELNTRVNNSQISHSLLAIQSNIGSSYDDLARRMGMSVDDLEKAERLTDDKMPVKFFFDYISHLGLILYAIPSQGHISSGIQVHINCIRELLGQLEKIPQGDRDISESALNFVKEVFEQFAVMMGETYSNIESEIDDKAKIETTRRLITIPPVEEKQTTNTELVA